MADAVTLWSHDEPNSPIGTAENPLIVSDAGGGGGGGDASAANQATGNASLSSIDTKTPALGQALAAASTPVVLTAIQIAALASSTNQGGVTETAPATDTASSGLNGRLQRIAQRLTSLIALVPASLGQKNKAGSLAVTLASDEDLIALHGAVTETAPASDTASSGLNGRLQRIAQRLTSLIALIPASLGQKTKATSLAVTLASDEDLIALHGAVTETAPATDTASSGLNGRLQRIAQRLTTILAGIPLLAGEAHIGQVGGGIVRITGTFTRPGDTTLYTAGDAVSDNATTTTLLVLSGMARVNGGSGYIVGARLSTNLKSIVPRFRVRIFNDAAPTRSGDNLAFKSLYADESKRVARFDLPAMITPIDTTNSDMSSTEDDTLRIPFVCAAGSTTLYAALETLDAFTPANAEQFSITCKVDWN